jgi:nitrilase
MEKATVAAVQATPEFLDRDATVQKVVRLTKEATGLGARLIVKAARRAKAYLSVGVNEL